VRERGQPDAKWPGPNGTIVNAEGQVSEKEVWGKVSNWMDYYGDPGDGSTVGVAILDHPSNSKRAYWHVRGYGLFAANPFGVHDFESKPKGTGNFTVAAGKSATFRYRFYLHPGDDKQAKVSDHYREYVSSIVSK